MADDLATLSTKINTTEEKIEKLERHIANNDFAGTPYDDRAEAKAALKDLRAKEVALQNEKVELLKEKNLLRQQQQQSGAGTSMLRVRLALVIFLLQRSCCVLANLVAFRVCLVACRRGLLLLDKSAALRA
jgi:chromosome segregation ATPase